MLWRDDPAAVRPMLATTAVAPLEAGDLAYEPKYDGIRAIAAMEPGGAVRFWSRLGNEKTAQFPEVAGALRQWARRLDRPVVVDGEIVATDEDGRPLGFQRLQGRIHLKAAPRKGAPVTYIVFDLLRDGDEDLRARPLRERRARLEALIDRSGNTHVRPSEQVIGDGRALHARAQAEGWEGLIAKRLDSRYAAGRRSPDWRKLKLVRRQACVVGGWTDPRGSRPFFGALLLGVYDERGRLQYVGHTGAGFTDAELGRVWKRLHALETKTSPFAVTPRTNERPHWTRPELVAEVKFTEWTADGRLRHPTYLGLRDDMRPQDVRKEPDTLLEKPVARAERASAADRRTRPRISPTAIGRLLEQIDAIERGRGDGVLELPGGDRLEVTNLRKVFWGRLKLTKADLFRHYIRVAPYILPAIADRPLVMKRYPNGVDAKPFYQHRAPDRRPAGVRVEYATSESETRPHLVGGSLTTLLYTVQLAAISQDPWFSRVQSEDVVDHVAFDLDPPEDAPFSRVRDAARWVRDELQTLGAPACAKTSGAGGLHVYVPMPPDTPYQAGLLFCQIVATIVARKHPKAATIERSLAARGRRIYVDSLQNVRGKTLASVYSARANAFAGVSTPVTWAEIDEGVSPRDFTIRTFAARLEAVGDLWAALRRSKGANLRAVMQYAEP
ncbi:MAG: DNA ligase D [Acidobacteria bacterium]|nr:DNA ligase D [Acidobacteriota bacterium]